MEILPEKYKTLSSLLSIFDRKEISIQDLHFHSPGGKNLTVRAEVSLPYSRYNQFLKALRGLADMRFVQLQDIRKVTIGRWLIPLFMVLVALDPIAATYLITEYNIHFLDLLSIRFWSIFMVLGVLYLVRRFWTRYVAESNIQYTDRNFVYSVIALVCTALFTYLSFDLGISPFFYQFSIYLGFFPFLALFNTKTTRFAFTLFLFFSVFLYIAYLVFALETQHLDPLPIASALAVSISFIAYTHFSARFQAEQHIHRRYLSFFRNLSFYGGILTLIPHFFRPTFMLPTVSQVIAVALFTIAFILIPYILYFIILGIHPYTSTLWRRLVMILILVEVGQVFLLGQPWNYFDIAVALLFIAGYWRYSLLSQRSPTRAT